MIGLRFSSSSNNDNNTIYKASKAWASEALAASQSWVLIKSFMEKVCLKARLKYWVNADCCLPWLPVLSNIEPPALWRKAATDKLVEKIVKHDSWPIQPDIRSPPLLRLTCSPSVRPHNPATGFRPPSATVVSAEPFSHGTGTLQCMQKEMATYRHWSASLWWDPDDVSHCRILSPDKTEWWLISATLCGWGRCFVADQLW